MNNENLLGKDNLIRNKSTLILFFILSVIICVLAMKSYTGSEMADDGAFFLRYAENMLHGEFWVWNLGEAPVWGASAPLYPLFIAIPMFFGVEPVSALFGTGIFLSTMSFSLLATYFASRFGFIIGFIFLIFVVTDVGLIYFSVGGLESPLVFFLISLAVWGILSKKSYWFIGIVAGILMVHKLDMVPVGVLLLGTLWIEEKKFPIKAIIIASVIALTWYVFAWIYFGAPVPNSFLTKSLYQNDFHYIIDWTWFSSVVFLSGMHIPLIILSIVSLFNNKFRVLTLFLFGIIILHTIAYTIKFPFEPYNWYTMPSIFSLIILSSIGLFTLIKYLEQKIQIKNLLFLVSIGTSIFLFLSYKVIINESRGIKNFLEYQEFDRAEAGRWVDKNVPKDYKVATSWGNPAFFSNRYVYDGSFLNRKYENGNLIKKYRPEILILQNNPGSTPMDPVFAYTLDAYVLGSDYYRVIKFFDKSYSIGMDYFFAVLAREDIADQIPNIDIPRDLFKYLREVRLGNNYGILKAYSMKDLFIHPGWTTPTTFKFKANSFKNDFKISPEKGVDLFFRIDPKISQEALNRSAGDVNIVVKNKDQIICSQNVKIGHDLNCIVSGDNVEIIVDNNGNPDTDWLLMSVK